MINADIIVDSSGIAGAVRSIIPGIWPLNEPLMKDDIGIGYRELCHSKARAMLSRLTRVLK